MTNIKNHAPTPWNVEERANWNTNQHCHVIPISSASGMVCEILSDGDITEQAHIDAAFVCRAVNCHEELLSALEYSFPLVKAMRVPAIEKICKDAIERAKHQA